ncbi:hypothetical protein VN97_g12563 [Penicillium thymicola]|uniref:Uncharacterized protein n=1 Tax=Penicillium thymicola TaxID=293382 RepID=A0AAI9T649_PENTH|nr:hypothetical protein VN97_g12563 [Penicillium thymicola]
MEEDVIKHPPCIPWDLSSDYGTQTLSHFSKNSHEKARHPVCYGTLHLRCLMGLRGDGGQEGLGEEEEKRRGRKRGDRPFIPSTTRTFLEWGTYFPNLSIS